MLLQLRKHVQSSQQQCSVDVSIQLSETQRNVVNTHMLKFHVILEFGDDRRAEPRLRVQHWVQDLGHDRVLRRLCNQAPIHKRNNHWCYFTSN